MEPTKVKCTCPTRLTLLLWAAVNLSALTVRGQQVVLHASWTVTGSSVPITFSPQLFQQFYSCLCKTNTKTCSASLKHTIGTDAIFQSATTIDATYDNTYEREGSSFHDCLITNTATTLVCSKLRAPNAPCDTTAKSTSFQMQNVTCDFSCVGILGSDNSQEILTTNTAGLIDFYRCREHCYGTSDTISNPGPDSSASQPSDPTSSRDSKTSAPPENKSDSSNETTGVIIGVVVSLVVVLIIAIILGIVLWRRSKAKSCVNERVQETQNVKSGGSRTLQLHRVDGGKQSGTADTDLSSDNNSPQANTSETFEDTEECYQEIKDHDIPTGVGYLDVYHPTYNNTENGYLDVYHPSSYIT